MRPVSLTAEGIPGEYENSRISLRSGGPTLQPYSSGVSAEWLCPPSWELFHHFSLAAFPTSLLGPSSLAAPLPHLPSVATSGCLSR